MSSLKEIRGKVSSIKGTQKITRAMEMVAASKMRRAQQRMVTGRPYAEHMQSVIAHLVHATHEYKHPYLVGRDVKRIGYIVVTSDRGLAGGLNINLFKHLVKDIKLRQSEGVEVCFAAIGQKAVGFFKSHGGQVLAASTHYGDKPTFEQINGAAVSMLDAYAKGEVDQIFMISNQFVNAMTQKPELKQLVPLPQDDNTRVATREFSWDYLYEPSAEELLQQLLSRYIESTVYQAVIENIAAEQSARMVAMKAATDNAGDLIKDLQLVYNKLRQAAITREISEIVGGAAAVE